MEITTLVFRRNKEDVDLNMKFSHVFPICPILGLRLLFYQTSTHFFQFKNK